MSTCLLDTQYLMDSYESIQAIVATIDHTKNVLAKFFYKELSSDCSGKAYIKNDFKQKRNLCEQVFVRKYIEVKSI